MSTNRNEWSQDEINVLIANCTNSITRKEGLQKTALMLGRSMGACLSQYQKLSKVGSIKHKYKSKVKLTTEEKQLILNLVARYGKELGIRESAIILNRSINSIIQSYHLIHSNFNHSLIDDKEILDKSTNASLIEDYRRRGLSIKQISNLTNIAELTIRRYLNGYSQKCKSVMTGSVNKPYITKIEQRLNPKLIAAIVISTISFILIALLLLTTYINQTK